MSVDTPETPTPKGMGTADPAGNTYPTLEDKCKGITMTTATEGSNRYCYPPAYGNSAPVKPYIPPDRGYYARTYGGKRRRK